MRLPEGWEIKTLEEIAKVTSGGTPSRDVPSFWGGSIPWVRTTEVQNCKIHETDVKEFITEEGLKNSSAKYVPENTILLAMIGQGKTRGQVAILKLKATTNQNCAAIIYDENQCPEYHFNYFLSQYENIRNLSNSAGQSNLSASLIKPIKVPVPPLPEQQKIAQILATWDKAIEKLEALIAAKQKRKKALMQQLLTGKMRFLGFDEEWKIKSLGDVCDYKNGGSFENDVVENGEYYLITLNSIDINGKLKNSHKKINCTDNSLKKDDLIMVLSDVAHGNFLGLCDVIPSDHYVLNQRMGALKPKIKINVFYLKTFINFNQKYFKLMGQGSSQQNLSKADIINFKIKYPSIEEQQKIAAVLSAADREIETQQKHLAALKVQKKGLMQQLLTGKKRVKTEV